MTPEAFLREMGILHSFQEFLLVLGLLLGRILPILIINPFLGGQVMPQNVKTGLGLLLAALLYHPVTAALVVPIPQEPLPYLTLLGKEVLIGTTIGFVSALVFYGIQAAGRVIDQARGASMGEMLAPQTGGNVSEMGEIQFQLSIVLFFLVNGHHILLRALFDSFRVVPIDRFPDLVRLAQPSMLLMAQLSAQVVQIALLLAAPAVVVTFFTDIAFGLINRVAPQINVFLLSMPVKMVAGLVIVLLALGFLVQQMRGFFAGALRGVGLVIEGFRGVL